MVAIIGRVQDISLTFPIRTLLFVAAPGYLVALGWLAARMFKG